MENIISLIDNIVGDVVDSSNELSATLLKVQVLAYKLKNDKLKEWADLELNGYLGKTVPEYRTIPAAVYGNLIQSSGWGGYSFRKNTQLPVEYLEKDVVEYLLRVRVPSPVAELEKMLKENGDYQINLSHPVQALISGQLANDWQVDSAWQKISLSSIEGIISSIKSNLLKFLLEINEEIGGSGDFSVMDNRSKRKIDQVFDKTIGSISGATVNVTIGNDTQQTVNTGSGAKLNIAKGDYNTQEISEGSKIEIRTFLKDLRNKLDLLGLTDDDKEDIEHEIIRVESQVSREKPRLNIINEGLKTINGILLGVATNAYTPVLLQKLEQLTSMIG